jgi:hypothetical protein
MRLPLASGRPTRRSGRPARLTVEALEDRSVPAFLDPVTSLTGGGRVIVADFNHDGRDDVAIIRGQASTPSPGYPWDFVTVGGKTKVSVALSNGDGTFQPPRDLRGGDGHNLTGFAASDVNGDGHLDLLVSTFTSLPRGGNDTASYLYGTGYDNVWLGKGDGTFRTARTTSYLVYESAFITRVYLPNPRSAAADFNGDGITDRATVDGSTSAVSVSPGNPNGTYQPAQAYAAGPSPGWVAAGDFNGDGRADVIVINSLYSWQPTLSVLLNDGDW